ncbi:MULTISPECIES: hypothetical protein [unclassified Mesorhizobium]|uniref:hypothetical protein n=1 Tax=unclassified Mesorhizobium TaxID=325217 RepID=UPI00109369AD|nr:MULTISPECIES: hypothetical protein [unclassified Mesorhizobium]TGS46406.1 hypothetical protein EN825_12460 [Mesorhizobium sp. M8A.F.Ca.ET.182.01.1.1]TGS81863.1 hypothetical protein EN824_12695 [Mesorhizobium sp. M8A.F.Ca.ET.181.01.1.1]
MDDANFLCMIWAVHAIQDGRSAQATRFLNHPKEAVTRDLTSKYYAYPWDLETLISLDFNTPKARFATNVLNLREFNTVADIVNLLRTVEDDETPGRVDDTNVLMEVHRIGHRQFGWQRRFTGVTDIYRYMFIYGQGECATYFETKYRVSVANFLGVAFAYFAYLMRGPWSPPIGDMNFLGISKEAIESSLKLLAGDIWFVRHESRQLLNKFETSAGSPLPVIYEPSYLRIRPIVSRDLGLRKQYIAPLPALVVMRATMGLYYDLQSGGTKITNDATARFEEYARRSIKAHCPGFDCAPPLRYRYKKNPVDTPDVLLMQDGRIVAVFECKATKLTFEAQYADDPLESAKEGYAQIAKAIFQLWRFFSHVRRGIIKFDVAGDAPAVVLTMDAWTQMSRPLRESLVSEARKIADEKEPEMIDDDRRHPIFCPIRELDSMLTQSDEGQLLAAFKAGAEPYYQGWSIEQVRTDAVPKLERAKTFAFDPIELLPWWQRKSDGAA